MIQVLTDVSANKKPAQPQCDLTTVHFSPEFSKESHNCRNHIRSRKSSIFSYFMPFKFYILNDPLLREIIRMFSIKISLNTDAKAPCQRWDGVWISAFLNFLFKLHKRF